MTDTKELSSLQYKLEWEDHLYELYGDFARRNNIDEWVYFLRRPEMAEKETSDKIAEMILRYVTTYSNVSQEIIKAIENVFHYTESREMYEALVGFEAMELYESHMLKNKEFPPYDLFDGFADDIDYDGYINLFNEIYYTVYIDDIEGYEEHLSALDDIGGRHPYEALLKSDYFFACGNYEEALAALKDLPGGYHKYMALGNIFAHMQEYREAETCLLEAVELRPDNLDGQLIGDLIMCKWFNDKPDEALSLIEGFIEAGYEHIVAPIKKKILSDIAKVLMEKGKTVELTEKELLLIKDCYKIFGDYSSVIKLSEISWNNGFTDESWTIDVTEAYFESGEFDNAGKIIEMVLDGRRQVSAEGQLKIREIRARLLFENGRIEDAYEIMKNICGQKDSDTKQKLVLAGMYMRTGNYRGALKLLRELHYYQSNNIQIKSALAECFMKMGEFRNAVHLFGKVCAEDPENKLAIRGLIQSAIDDDNENCIENAQYLMDKFKEMITDDEMQYYQGQIFEMQEKFKEAQQTYKSIIDKYEEGVSDKKLLQDAAIRYFIVMEENNGTVGKMEAEIQKLLEQHPDADVLWAYLADFYDEIDYKTELREDCYKKALAANRFNGEARMKLAGIYVNNDKAEKALELYSEMILYTEDKDAYLMRAYQLADIGEYKQAQIDIGQYENLGGEKSQSIDLKSMLAMLNGEYEYALETLEELNKINKGKKAPVYDDIAICLCKMGRAKEAIELLDVACESKTNPVFYKVLYDIQVYSGLYKDAKKTVKRYRKAFGIGRLDEWTGLLSAYADLSAGKGQAAYTLTMSMIEPEGERLNGILEMLYGKPKAAIKLLKSALKNEPDELDNYSWLAFVYYLSGDHAAAAEVAGKGLELFADTYGDTDKYLRSAPLCQYGFLKMMCGEMDEAYEMFKRAASQPTCPEFVCQRCYEAYAATGIYYAIKGDTVRANRFFEESLKENPGNTICKKIQERLC